MKFIAYSLVLSAFLFQSCKDVTDVLDRTPIDKISEVDVWKDETLTKAYVTGLYSRFPFAAFDYNTLYNWTDEGTTSTGNASNMTMGTVSRSSEGNAYWDYIYVRDCNVFLDKIKIATISEATKKQLEGEVRFIRAYVYFEMMKRYGGVPLVDVVIDPFASVEEKYAVRATEEAIADFIDAELTTASGLLGTDATPRGKANKWTALALKARAMLWAASIAKFGTVNLNGLVGIPAAKANTYYTKASEAAEAVIASGKYSLFNGVPNDKAENYRKVFVTENNSEVIFEKVYNGPNLGHNWDAFTGPNQWAVRGGVCDPSLDFILGYENADGSMDQPVFGADNLYASGAEPFAKKDPRLFGTVFFQNDKWATGKVETYEGLDPSPTPNPTAVIRNPNTLYQGVPTVGIDSRTQAKDDFSTNSGFLNKKYLDDSEIKIPEGQSKTNWIVFRLAELYLTKAEAEFELGNAKKAVDALNMTRSRAGISLVTEATLTRDRIRTERRSELAFEGHRYWDLRRWRTAQAVLNTRIQGLQIILHHATGKYYFLPLNAESFTRVFRAEHYYNPITNSRIDNNSKLVENPLY
ncbi:RagB/SusD family nutrient uptake outer membrane protein [Larkinella bovis]|uniref:RagB/SusD family nutrient uptake outer membrane protein n=1 Tax=Larkinella bovis TaxID=683041 RepID=A0ABW0ICL9_9BACT